jgi:hypothetical protein
VGAGPEKEGSAFAGSGRAKNEGVSDNGLAGKLKALGFGVMSERQSSRGDGGIRGNSEPVQVLIGSPLRGAVGITWWRCESSSGEPGKAKDGTREQERYD